MKFYFIASNTNDSQLIKKNLTMPGNFSTGFSYTITWCIYYRIKRNYYLSVINTMHITDKKIILTRNQ